MDHEAVGSVSKPSAPKIYDVWRRKEEERKVNKNLGEITVPGGGKPRLISCTRLSPSCLHLRSHSLTRSNLFSLVPRCIIFHPPSEERERERAPYYWEQSRRRIVRGREGLRPTYFTFLPISFLFSPHPVTFILSPPLYTSPRRRASNGWCMQRYTRPSFSFTSSRARENSLIEHGKSRHRRPGSLDPGVGCFLHARYPFDRNLVVEGGNGRTRDEERGREREIA